MLSEADVVHAICTELGGEITAQYTLAFSGRLIHLDAAPQRIGATHRAVAVVGGAKGTLETLFPHSCGSSIRVATTPTRHLPIRLARAGLTGPQGR